MAKVAVFIDHEIVLRHFIHSGVFRQLEGQHSVVYVFPQNHRRVTTDPFSLGLEHVELLRVSDDRAYRWRRLFQASVLKKARRTGERDQVYSYWREALGGRRNFARLQVLSWSGVYWFYKRHILRLNGPNTDLTELLAREAPDVILHPTVLEGLFVSDLLQWRESHASPVVFLMNSWDNPSGKAMTLNFPDYLAVWGPQTKEHAVQLLGCPESRVICMGAAQFDVFRQPPATSRTALLARMGFEPTAKTLLYAGSSKGLDEVSHLLQLERAIKSGEMPKCNLVFRPHPWRGIIKGEPDFFEIDWRHVAMDSEMVDYYRASRTDQSLIFLPDYTHTHSLLSAVDALVSPVSTILLEAAMHGKPILAYMPHDEVDDNSFVRTMANMRFMKEFFDRFEASLCQSRAEFIPACKYLLDMTERPGIEAQIRRETSHFVSDNGISYAQQLLELVDRLSITKKAA